MAALLVSDELWSRIEPLLPKHAPPGPRGGRPWIDDRKALTGILFVLKTGIPWEYLPREMDCGCGMTCWRRLRDWQAAGVWDKLLAVLLAELRGAGKIDWSRAAVDSSSIRAVGGGEATGPNPTDRGRLGSKHHILVSGNGVPLAVSVTGANVPDVKQAIPLLLRIPFVRGKVGHPKRTPKRLYGDRAYDSGKLRALTRLLGVIPMFAKRLVKHGSGLGKFRWVVERTISWLHQQRRLRTRYEHRTDMHSAFLTLAANLICFHIFLGLS